MALTMPQQRTTYNDLLLAEAEQSVMNYETFGSTTTANNTTGKPTVKAMQGSLGNTKQRDSPGLLANDRNISGSMDQWLLMSMRYSRMHLQVSSNMAILKISELNEGVDGKINYEWETFPYEKLPEGS